MGGGTSTEPSPKSVTVSMITARAPPVTDPTAGDDDLEAVPKRPGALLQQLEDEIDAARRQHCPSREQRSKRNLRVVDLRQAALAASGADSIDLTSVLSVRGRGAWHLRRLPAMTTSFSWGEQAASWQR